MDASSGIGGGENFTIALKNDGSIWTFGNNEHGELGNGTIINSSTPLQANVFSSTNPAIAIAVGDIHVLALKSDGTVWAWGDNSQGEIGSGTFSRDGVLSPIQITQDSDGNTFNGIISISGGGDFSLALKNDGTVWSWGYNYYGELGNGTIYPTYAPAQVSGLSGVQGISAGFWNAAAVKNDGTVWTWGQNTYGQLGNGTTTNSYSPVQVTGLTNVFSVAAGENYTLALKNDKTVWGWGSLLGNGGTINSSTPVQITGLEGIVELEGKYGHIQALKEDGSIAQWGQIPVADGGIFFSGVPIVARGVNLIGPSPAISITSPANNSNVVLGSTASLQVSATTSGSGRSIANVQYFNENVLIGSSSTSPFTISWTPTTWGDYHVKAVATDNAGSPGASSVVTLHVPYDSDANGLPDWWENYYLGAIGQNPGALAPSGNGLTLLQSYQDNVSPTDYYNGVLPTLSIVSGNSQAGVAGTFLPNPLVVKVTNSGSVALANAPVTFMVTGSAGELSTSPAYPLAASLTIRTGTDGKASVYFQAPSGSGTSASVTATVATGTQSIQQTFVASIQPVPTAGLQVWMRADAGITLNGTSSSVSAWSDQSGNGNDAAQASSGNMPTLTANSLNGLPSVHFDGSSGYLNLPNFASGFTAGEMFVVLRTGSYNGSTTAGFIQMGNTSGTGASYPSGGQVIDNFGSSSLYYTGTVPIDLTQWHLYDVSSQPGGWVNRFNSVVNYISATNVVGFPTSPDIGLSGSNYFNGDIAEILIYNRTLSNRERREVQHYLANRYNQFVFETGVPGSSGSGAPTITLTEPFNAQLLH